MECSDRTCTKMYERVLGDYQGKAQILRIFPQKQHKLQPEKRWPFHLAPFLFNFYLVFTEKSYQVTCFVLGNGHRTPGAALVLGLRNRMSAVDLKRVFEKHVSLIVKLIFVSHSYHRTEHIVILC